MTSRNVYLHIGPHKTGSTYLQKALNSNYAELLRRNKNYTRISRGGDDAHHKLAELYRLKRLKDTASFADEILSETNGDVIISSENFDRLDSESVHAFKKDYADFNVIVLYFSRSLGDLLVSNWQEDVKHGSILSWGDYSFIHLLRPFQSTVLNKNKVLDVFEHEFGENAICLFDYDLHMGLDSDIYEVLTGFLGLSDLPRMDRKLQINKSMPYPRIELIRALNIRRASGGKRVDHSVRSAFLEYVRKRPGCEHVKFLEDKIEENSVSIRFDESFTLKAVDKIFREKYSRRFFSEKTNFDHDKKYILPIDGWVFAPRVQASIDAIFREVEAILDASRKEG